MKTNNDKEAAISGGFWMTISTAATMLAQFLRLVILTRFLEKSDFGVVSIINMVVGLCLTFTDLGFASSIMYKQNISNKEFSTLYWTQFILFFTIYGILSLTSPLIGMFYNESSLVYLIPIAGSSILFQAIGKLYDSVLQKKYKFKIIAILSIVANFSSLFLAWFLAAHNYGVYSLILSTLFSVTIYNIGELIIGLKYQRLSFCLNIKDALPLIKIGIYQTGTHILDFMSNKIDVMIIGKLLGVEILGVYDLAKELVIKFVGLIRTIVSKVALPILANNNNNDENVKLRFLQITKIVAIICTPICILLAVFSKEVVTIIYGEKFIEASLIVAIFAIVSLISAISCFIDMLGVAKGKTKLNFTNTVYRIIVTTPIVLITSLISIEAVAWGQLIAAMICFFIFWNVVTMNTYPMSLKEYFSQFGKYFILTCCVGIIVAISRYIFPLPTNNIILNTLLYLFLFVFLFGVSSCIFLKDEIVFIISMMPQKLRQII